MEVVPKYQTDSPPAMFIPILDPINLDLPYCSNSMPMPNNPNTTAAILTSVPLLAELAPNCATPVLVASDELPVGVEPKLKSSVEVGEYEYEE